MEIEESILAVCALLLVMLAMRDVVGRHSHHAHQRVVRHRYPRNPKH